MGERKGIISSRYLRVFIFLLIALFIWAAAVVILGPVMLMASIQGELLPEIDRFDVTPLAIASGESATLRWETQNAELTTIDHNVGDVSGTGQAIVAPRCSTTYQLTVSNNAGVRKRFITLNVSLSSKPESTIVPVDPVTGRNSSINMAWTDYCYSDKYQVQVARDPGFALKVYDSGVLQPADSMSPAFWYPPGVLEAGHTYYWRVRVTQAVTGQWSISPWSDTQQFTVRPGYAVRESYYGLQALNPFNNCASCPVGPIGFSWTGYPDTTVYRFVLARDPQLQNLVVDTISTGTSYQYLDKLERDTAYYWQVSAAEPVPSDPSAVFTFRTAGPEVLPVKAVEYQQGIPAWASVVIIIGAALTTGIVVLLFKVEKKY